MEKEIDSDYLDLLNSFSNKIAFKIMTLLHKSVNGFNLTDTANSIGEKTSTVNDHLEKLFNARLIYRKDKKFHLSNYGNFILNYLNNLKILDRVKEIFGNLPARRIPLEYIHNLIPSIKDVEIQTNQWKFMKISSSIIKQIQVDVKKGSVNLNILGWESLALSLDIIENYFQTLTLAPQSLQEFFNKTNFELITDRGIIEDTKNNQRLIEIMRSTDLKQRIMICEKVEKFDFTLFRYKNTIHFFLNEETKGGINYSVLFKDNPGAIRFFNKVYDYYLEDSNPLHSYIG
jgi:predicted transcriptional regulator